MAGPNEPEEKDSELDETGADAKDDDGAAAGAQGAHATAEGKGAADNTEGSGASAADPDADDDEGHDRGDGEDEDEDERSPEDDLEDEFADFIDEELGYADVDWDTVPKKELDRHDELRAMAPDELDGVDLKKLNDLHRWAVARAYLAHGDEAAFETVAKPLLAAKKPSPALDYVDIALAMMSRKARRGDFEGAFDLLEALRTASDGDEDLVKRFRGILTLQRGDRDEGLEMLAQLAEAKPDDPYFLLSLGEDLCGIGYWEEAVEYLEIAEELAKERADQDLLASIENAAQFAQRQLEFDDVVDD